MCEITPGGDATPAIPAGALLTPDESRAAVEVSLRTGRGSWAIGRGHRLDVSVQVEQVVRVFSLGDLLGKVGRS